MADVAAWWWLVTRITARQFWDALPGPWPVKVTLLVVCVAIPGGFDELVLLAVVAWWRRQKGRKP